MEALLTIAGALVILLCAEVHIRIEEAERRALADDSQHDWWYEGNAPEYDSQYRDWVCWTDYFLAGKLPPSWLRGIDWLLRHML